MEGNRLHTIRLLSAALLVSCALPASASGDACFDAAQAAPLIALDAQLPAKTEELVVGAIAEAMPPQTLFLLVRQMMLSERIHRRLLERSDCAAASEAIERDLSIMKRVFVALADGDEDLRIAAMKAEQSQALLGEIRSVVDELGKGIAALVHGTPASR